MLDRTSPQQTDTDPRAFRVYTVRLPLDLADAIRAAAERRYEPQSVLVRRLVTEGLQAEQHQAGGRR